MFFHREEYDVRSMNPEQLLVEYFALRNAVSGINNKSYRKTELSQVKDTSFKTLVTEDDLEYSFISGNLPAPLAGTELRTNDFFEDKAFEAVSLQAEWPKKNISDNEILLMKRLYNELSRRLLPYVDEVLNVYDISVSPLYEENLDRETLAQIVDQIIDSAKKDIPEINSLQSKSDEASGVVRALVEALALNDIFAIRRPNRRRSKFIV